MCITLSIVIPAYNVASYIEGTLQALLSQWQPGVEIIVVDDGSKDATADTIRLHFALPISEGKLKLIQQENQGVSQARNLGISNAKGDYIGFVDADDYVLPDYIATILGALTDYKGKLDILEFGYKTFVKNHEEVVDNTPQYSNSHFGYHDVQLILNHVYATARWYPWTRVFKINLFDQVKFPSSVRFCEDLMTIPQLYEQANTILVLQKCLYGYRINPAGATYNIQQDYFDNLLDYYHKIPATRHLRYEYLRFSVAFALFSCGQKSKQSFELPFDIRHDIHLMRFRWQTYARLEWRKVMVLCYPALFQCLRELYSWKKNVLAKFYG